ncbi:MAG TPA: YgeY family selenium metabolism-linked hydrolase [Bryobacteraceae bacterium]|nr:YgeY family selenium metabolism-linked hydrolase [Bryobacteraceae bacterium]
MMQAVLPDTLNRERLAALAQSYEPDIVRFLRDLIAIPAESCQEGPVIQRIRQEMENVGFDEVRIDPMGNILGRIGSGKKIIMMDSHTDTVGVGDPKEWGWDPHRGKVEDGYVWGRGACDQRAGMASMVYAGKMIQELGLHDDYTLYVVGSVQEEDCDGLCWLYILKEDGIRPDCVVITEPTNLGIYRGHRGRMEIELHLRGRSCHASAPERGDNPVYRMTRIIQEVENLNARLRQDYFLGKGTIAVTQIRSLSPSLCAVPGACAIHLDRRLTAGETKESALAEVRTLPGAEHAEIDVLTYETPSYTGLRYPMEKYYPTWVLDPSHPLAIAAVSTFCQLWDRSPHIDKWTFSTNGVATMGLMGVPTIGFGPGEEEVAHSVLERVPIRHLVDAAQFYAAFPLNYLATIRKSNG